MKTILILILALALLVAAFASRPGRREFVLYLLDTPTSAGSAWSSSAVEHAEKVSKGVTVKDRFLWTEVRKDDKVLYVGVFANFVPNGDDATKYRPSVGEIANLLGKMQASE